MTTKSQEVFEEKYARIHDFTKLSNGDYADVETFLGFKVWEMTWEASRKQALEEAARICSQTCSPYPTDSGDGYNQGALDCEKKIKELMK